MSMLVVGPTPCPAGWDGAWRQRLVQSLRRLAAQLWQVGINDIFLDGSFVEDKLHPGDIDGYFVCDQADYMSGRLVRALNALEPSSVWDFRVRLPDPAAPSLLKPLIWHVYRVELYPEFGQFSGILDEFGQNQIFPAAFRKARRERGFRPKGIVRLVR